MVGSAGIGETCSTRSSVMGTVKVPDASVVTGTSNGSQVEWSTRELPG